MVDKVCQEAHEDVDLPGDSEAEEESEEEDGGDAEADKNLADGAALNGSGTACETGGGSTCREQSSDSRAPPRKCCFLF